MSSRRHISQATRVESSSAPSGLIQRCACGGTPGPTGECAECRRKRLLQPKLTINRPGDCYEQEADRVAEQVMRMPASAAGTSAALPVRRLAQQHDLQRQEQEDEEEDVLHMKAAAARGGPGTTEAPQIVHDVIQSSGRPLEGATRRYMETRFRHDFSAVRVHTDARAASSARAVQARAYTVGRNVVFGSGQYAPDTASGRQLLAHELTHVLQQGPASLPRPTPVLQRAVRESVVAQTQPHAQVCLVHLHGDEQNALHTAQDLQRSHCANLVHLSSTDRLVHVDVASRGRTRTCQADPNRIFTTTGLSSHALQGRCAVPTQARRELEQFRDQQLAPAIRTCRGGGSTGLQGPLPVVSLHNNTPGSLSIESYKQTDPRTGRRGGEAGATERDPARLGGAPNPSVAAGEDPDNFFLVTSPADFTALRGSRNVVLQDTMPTDDGSLSVALAGDRYINVEAEGKRFDSRNPQRAAHFATNRTMALEALNQLGVSSIPCTAPEGTVQRQEADTAEQPAPIPEVEDREPRSLKEQWEAFWRLLLRLLREVIRLLEQLETMPDPLPREAPPSNLPQGCQTYGSQADLDIRKAHWAGIIGGMPVADVVSWIIGRTTPPRAARREAEEQRDCMLAAIRTAASRSGSGISLPTGSLVHSGHRDFGRQRSIWERKFDFRGRPFDRISDHARTTCGTLIGPSETRWDPANPAHRVCWNVAPRRGTTPPALPAGARPLTDDERQQEILQASSAPGISRHHWGTDFDLFDPDMNPEEWKTGRPFADEYSWMRRNASSYGFIQSFTATSTFMTRGYIEERWHWSYYPISQALLEFARTHQSDIETSLRSQWGASPQFSFILAHWRDYMFNVAEGGVF